jgi:hypothetical protein
VYTPLFPIDRILLSQTETLLLYSDTDSSYLVVVVVGLIEIDLFFVLSHTLGLNG